MNISPAYSLLLASAMLTTAAHADTPLFRDGQPLATIYSPVVPLPTAEMPRDKRGQLLPEPQLAIAIRELNYHLQKMTGAVLPVVKTGDVAAVKGPAIVLGELATKQGAQPQKNVASGEGFRLLTKGDRLLIGGQSDEAVLFGVYEVLEKLGCDWVLPGEIGEIVPLRKTVSLPDLDESQAPDFLTRRLWYRGYNPPRLPAEGERYAQWFSRQKGGNYSVAALDASGHVWPQFIKKHQAEFDKDPTMYSLRRAPDGTLKRMGPQIETTHPRVIELFVQDIKDAFEKNNWPKDKEVAFGIGPADGLGYSVSVESQLVGSGRVDPVVGDADQTDLLVLLGNTILERVNPEYPNVYVGFYSYSVHADYPQRYKPNPHLVQIFAPINFSRYHSILDENSKTQAYYKIVVEQWGKLAKEQGNPLIYRGYNWNLAENMLPYSKVKIWGEELPFYQKMGISGLNVEATKEWGVLAPSDTIFMKLAWDSSQDWHQLLEQYCRHAFGAGWEPMNRYFLRLIETQDNAGEEAGSFNAIHLIFDDAFVVAARKDFAEATKLAQTADDKTRVSYFGYAVESLKLYLDYHAATRASNYAEAKRDYDAMLAQWQKTYDVNTDLAANEAPAYLKRFLGKFVEEGLQFSSGDYKMVQPLPDALKTMFDPLEVGNRMRYQSPQINDAGFIETKTFSTTWDAQGLTGLRTGSVWYRHHFSLPAELKGQPIGLFLGGFEDEARVWINGELVGTSGVRFSNPAEFDLTGGIKYEGDNVLAIQIVRNSAANEIGLGGLIRPSYIFTGPKLETKAPKPLELRRVLPGGELGEIEK